MNNTMSYKGFTAKVEFSPDDEVFFGRLIGIDDVVTFEGQTVDELKKSFAEAVDFHLEVCEKTGQKLKKNYSGKLLFRFNSELHARIAAAESKGKSINEFAKEVFESAIS